MNPSHHHQPLFSHSHAARPSNPLASYTQQAEPSPPYTATPTSHHSPDDQFEVSPPKRQKLAASGPAEPGKTAFKRNAPAMDTKLDSAHTGLAPRRRLSEDGTSENKAGAPANPAVSKSKRVRTGCLTCRERHLKCDEGLPDCNNCRKSNRECKRGVRLNFIDTQVKNPPIIPRTLEWSVQFQDESRLIASEYRGGLGRYPRVTHKDMTPPRELDTDEGFRVPASAPDAGHDTATLALSLNQRIWHHQTPSAGTVVDDESHQQHRKESDAFLPAATPTPASQTASLSGTGGMLQDQYVIREDALRRSHSSRNTEASGLPSPYMVQGSMLTPQGSRSASHGTPLLQSNTDGPATPPNEKSAGEKEYLSSEDEIRFMQAFINEVAVWMDLFDKDKHFSKMVPYLALESPMLLNALLACGVKQLTLVDGQSDEKALYYYDAATRQLLNCLKDPDRNMAECATTAVILNVYEVMTDKPNQRMSHIAGARALIRECGWDATSPGIGAACFWINIGMEVLSCLSFNWQTAWDPDQWGLDLEFTNWTPTPRTGSSHGGEADGRLKASDGDEEVWVQRIFYIVAKISNFKANIPRFQEPSPHDEQVRRQSRFNEWKRLKGLCDAWNSNCPRSMQPYAYSHTPSSKSLFPHVWLLKTPAILGRLYYHTAMCLLAQVNPMEPRDSEDNRVSQLLHARHTCGILAHTNDRAIKNASIRCLAVAAAALADRQEQAEVLAILEKTGKETGWRLGKVCAGLKETWRWETDTGRSLAPVAGRGTTAAGPGPPPGFFSVTGAQDQHSGSTASAAPTPAPVAAPTPTRPTINPLLANADFSKQNHPYQNWYEPPNRTAG